MGMALPYLVTDKEAVSKSSKYLVGGQVTHIAVNTYNVVVGIITCRGLYLRACLLHDRDNPLAVIAR